MTRQEPQPSPQRGTWRRTLRENATLLRLLIITVGIFTVMSLLRPDAFFTVNNLTSMAFQFPEFALLALAMTLAMLTGGIDLSIIGTANLSAILGALIMREVIPAGAGGGTVFLLILLALSVTLLTGTVCGFINGLLVARVGISPILATLGTFQLYTGIAIVITGGSAVLGLPGGFSVVGNGRVGLVPVPLIVFAVFAVAVGVLLNHSAYGAKVYMLGTNPLAARFAGLNNNRLLIRTYVLCGFLSAVAGIVMMSRANSAKADFGSSYLLLTILIAVLGGVNPYGGFGKVSGVVLAVLSLQFLSSGFNILRFSNFARELIWGALLLLVMVLNIVDYRALKKRLFGGKHEKDS